MHELEFHQTQDSQRGGRWEVGNTTETTFDLWETKRWTWWNIYINWDVRNEENWQCGDSCIAHAFGDLQAFYRLHCLINRELMTHQWVPENSIRFGILSTWRVFWLIPGSLGKIIQHYPKFLVFHPGWSNYPLIKLCRASLRHGITDFIPQWSWLRRSQQNFVPLDAPTTASLTSLKKQHSDDIDEIQPVVGRPSRQSIFRDFSVWFSITAQITRLDLWWSHRFVLGKCPYKSQCMRGEFTISNPNNPSTKKKLVQ